MQVCLQPFQISQMKTKHIFDRLHFKNIYRQLIFVILDGVIKFFNKTNNPHLGNISLLMITPDVVAASASKCYGLSVREKMVIAVAVCLLSIWAHGVVPATPFTGSFTGQVCACVAEVIQWMNICDIAWKQFYICMRNCRSSWLLKLTLTVPCTLLLLCFVLRIKMQVDCHPNCI